MLILVDYDNIESNILRHGILHVVTRILSKIDPGDVDNTKRINIRLYGGWYEHNNFTQRAQNLSSDLVTNFPNTAKLSDNSTTVLTNCEMAYSILADPTNHLFHTYRSRGMPSGLRAIHPSNRGCSSASCPIINTYNFIRNNSCNVCHSIKPSDIFYRGEQKLVDTMLTSDLIFSSYQNVNIAIVSSDDDFWPGIKTTLSLGRKIIQLHTRNRNTPTFYTRTTTTNYIQKQL
jgi:uncharacterized LabA/DUF88 family protein